MPLKWTIFGIANYALLLLYAFILHLSFKVIIEKIPAETDLTPLLPILISNVIIVLNSLFNIIVFHRHLPGNPFSHSKGILNLAAAILYFIALIIMIYSLNQSINDELRSGETEGLVGFLQALFFSTIVLGIFIFVNQLMIRNYLEKTHLAGANDKPFENKQSNL